MKVEQIKEALLVRNVKTGAPKRTYDVRITLNKSGGGRFCIRFGLLNRAAEILGKAEYVQVTDVEKLSSRIYFVTEGAEKGRGYKVSVNGAAKEPCRYFTFTPSKKAEKIYRASWINGTYELRYDNEARLYYIEAD